MFQHGALTLFPRGLDQSILVAVLIGIYILLFFTEMFGWVWAGLVVPGYLASVFAIQPAAGVAVCIEATLTYVASRAISDTMSRWGGWSPFFGRERFFLIVLVSVFVRQMCEIWFLDEAIAAIDHWTGASLPTGHEFSSIGLVLVPLLANMAWKLTLPRATFQIGVSVGLTWLLVAKILLQYTNLSYASLELTYENVALDFLGSPKAYMVLLTTAFFAARYNLFYGWDYNGIMVPSLIALTWFQPSLLATTVIESLILLYMTRAVLAIPLLKRRNFEGPRKLAVVFSVGFVLKMALGWTIGTWWPGLHLIDLFGFGYVLTSLLAVKMLNLKKTGRVLLPSIAVSLLGFVVGSAAGFGLEQILPRGAVVSTGPTDIATSQRLLGTSSGVMALGSVRAQGDRGARAATLGLRELADYATLWTQLDAWLAGEHVSVGVLTERAARLGLRLGPLRDGPRPGWSLVDADERLAFERGWDTVVLFPGAPGPVIEVPRPRRERPAAEAAAALCEALACRAIVVSGTDASHDVPAQSPFHVVHRALDHDAVLELRADTSVARGRPHLHIRTVLPGGVRLAALWPGAIELSWDVPPDSDVRWRRAAPFVVLRVHPDDLWQRLAEASPPVPSKPELTVVAWIDKWITPVDATPSAAPAPEPDVAPQPPSATELLVLEQLVMGPLAERRAERVPWIAQVAQLLGHELIWLPDGARPGAGAWVVSGSSGRGWLAVAIAAHPSSSLVIEVPRPRVESGVGRVAAQAWVAAGAAALVLDAEWSARSVQRAAGIPSYPDPLVSVATAFQATHQALARAIATLPEPAILQLRGFAPWRAVRDDLVVSLGTPVLDPTHVPVAIARVVARDGVLGRLASTPRWEDGGADVVGLSGAGNPQLLHVQNTGGAPFAIVWFGMAIRAAALPTGDREDARMRAARVGVGFAERPLATAVTAGLDAAAPPGVGHTLLERARPALTLAVDYATTGDLAALAELGHARGVARTIGWSEDLGVAYVMIELKDGTAVLRAAVPMVGGRSTACAPIEGGAGAEGRTWQAIQAKCAQIIVTGTVVAR